MLKKWPVYIQPLHRETTLHIYLPDDYEESGERYPVMYMFDGHNLFLDEDATFGTSWNLLDFLDHYDKKFIVVGIECDHEGEHRLQEYTPYVLHDTFFGPANGNGALLMHWIVNWLKPEIDSHLPTWPQRGATGIAGSSMGGLMAFYGLIHHNNVFSKAACLSPSLFIAVHELEKDMMNWMDPDTRVYWSFGTREMRGSHNLEAVERLMAHFKHMIEERGGTAKMNIVFDGRHSEFSWAKESIEWFDFLWK